MVSECHFYHCPALPEKAVVFLGESYEFVLEWRSYVSCINYLKLLLAFTRCLGLYLQFARSGTSNVDVHTKSVELTKQISNVLLYSEICTWNSTLKITSIKQGEKISFTLSKTSSQWGEAIIRWSERDPGKRTCPNKPFSLISKKASLIPLIQKHNRSGRNTNMKTLICETLSLVLA